MGKTLYVVAGLMGVFLTGSALALTFNGNAKAVIKRALSITENQGIDYATIGVTSEGATVKLTPTGSISSTARGYTFSGVPTAGNVTINGEPNTLVNVSFTEGSLTSSEGQAMTLNNLFSNPTGSGIVTNSSGSVDLSIGADLIVNASQKSGSYSGTYGITVNY